MVQSSGSGISLQLAPSVEGALPQNYSLREQPENITPTLVFADLAGRLSALCSNATTRACLHSSAQHTKQLLGGPHGPTLAWHAAGTEGRVKRKFDLVMKQAQVGTCPAL